MTLQQVCFKVMPLCKGITLKSVSFPGKILLGVNWKAVAAKFGDYRVAFCREMGFSRAPAPWVLAGSPKAADHAEGL